MYALKQINIWIPGQGTQGLGWSLRYTWALSAQVSDKLALALGTMSRFSVQLLNCTVIIVTLYMFSR